MGAVLHVTLTVFTISGGDITIKSKTKVHRFLETTKKKKEKVLKKCILPPFFPFSACINDGYTPPKNIRRGKNASADVFIESSRELLLVAVPPYGDGPSVILTVPHYFVTLAVGHAGAGNLSTDGLQVLAVVVVLV